jgi:hypothetical protein
MAGPFLTRTRELFVQLESAFNTSPGALAGTDAFKHKDFTWERDIARYDRKDHTRGHASVLTTHKGREFSKWSIAADLIPSGNGTTITAPDIDPFLEAHFGTKHAATAHTTTGTGSTGTTLELATGGGAASGVAIGDLIAVSVNSTYGYEVRRVTGVSTDTVTIDRALSADPASGRTVKLGVTYKVLSSALKSLHLWEFMDGDNVRQKAGGCVVQNFNLDVNFGQQQPVVGVTIDGVGTQKVAQTGTSRPTPSTAGVPLIPTEGKCWIGAALLRVTNYSLKSNTGLDVHQGDSSSLYPTRVKRTAGDETRSNIMQTLGLILETGTIEGYYDAEAALTAYSTIMQFDVTPGVIVAIACPKWIPLVPLGDIGGEVSLAADGRAYGTTGDDEIYLAFI